MKKIVIIFPGIGYHADKPLLYFASQLAAERGYAEQKKLSYSYQGGNIRGNRAKMQEAFETLYAQAEEALSGVAWNEYEDILFLSKSVGTIIACAYAQKHGITCRQVLYTPLEDTFRFLPRRSGNMMELSGTENALRGSENALSEAVMIMSDVVIAFTGTADPWVEPGAIEPLCVQTGVPVTVIEGGNHSLEVRDEQGAPKTARNLEILKQVMDETGRFLDLGETER